MQDFKNKFNLQGIVGDIKSNIKSMINPSANASPTACSTSTSTSTSSSTVGTGSAQCDSLTKNMADLVSMMATLQKVCAEQSDRLAEVSRLVHASSEQVKVACSHRHDHCCDVDES